MGLADFWYVLCRSDALTEQPRATQLLGQPLVLFRGAEGRAFALLDRCPHRNVPLSLGEVRSGALVCRYHGWHFDGAGACLRVPGRAGSALPKECVPSYATSEQDGYVWAWGRPDTQPTEEPYSVDVLDRDHTVLHASADYPADLHASLENTIDVPHTAFLHRGLFRSAQADTSISCKIARDGRIVRARYRGEVRPDTWLARILAPGGGTLEHEDRFIAPSIVRVEYRLGPRAHLLSTAFFTPLDERRTRLHVQIAYRLAVPGGWLAPLLARVTARVLREDAEILGKQTENLRRFGGEQFASTELDLFSMQIKRVVVQAERGTIEPEQSERDYEFTL